MEIGEYIRQYRAKTDKFESDFDYITVAEYAQKVGKTANTIRRYIADGRLESINIGAKKLIKIRRSQDGEKLLAENKALREENAVLRERLSVIRQLVEK